MSTPEKQRYEERKQFLEDLKTLVRSEHEEIFRIIKRADVEFSENSNGVFFDVNSVQDSEFEKLKAYVELCKSQRQEENKRAKEMEDLRAETVA